MKAVFRSFNHCTVAAFGIALAGATPAWSQKVTTPTFNTPLQHIIVVIQENRTPDNLFGADLHNNPRLLPGADLAGSGQCKSKTPSTITLKPGPLDTCVDPDHSHAIAWRLPLSLIPLRASTSFSPVTIIRPSPTCSTAQKFPGDGMGTTTPPRQLAKDRSKHR